MKKTVTLTVTLTFSGEGISDEQAIIRNVADTLLNQVQHSSIVGDNDTEYTETIEVGNKAGNLLIDVATGETI